MFSKQQRLSKEEISEILEKPFEKRNSINFFLKVSPSLEGGVSKFAVVISKKVSKLAVTRHFIKRKVIEILKEIVKEGKLKPNMYIISVQKDISEIDRVELKEELVKILI